MRSTRAVFDSAQPRAGGKSGTPPLVVLVDDGDGAAEAMARVLRGNGMKRYAILMGGEINLARHGQPGLQRIGSMARMLNQPPAPATK